MFRIKKNIPAVFLNVTRQFSGERTCKFLYSKAVALMFLSKKGNTKRKKKEDEKTHREPGKRFRNKNREYLCGTDLKHFHSEPDG